MGRERARLWRREYGEVSRNAEAEDVADLVFGSDAADRMGVRDDVLKKRLQRIAARFSSRDFLFFDPSTEPPPKDMPMECGCGEHNPRGRKICQRCRTSLTMMSAYEVWSSALTTSYTGQQYGVRLGASYTDVLNWLPVMRPYPNPPKHGDSSDFYWAIYAVTHVVYTLNDYSAYKLSPSWLPDEYAFLKRNLTEAIKMADPEALGEFLDSLKSFGLVESHPLIRKGMNYLLSSQNGDGSWGDADAEDIYERFHSTWTGIDGLREYSWRGERLSFQRLKPLLGGWAR
ncbi:MAG: hypothetical protein H7Z16_12920 [Pyrinomonadaceae bacterium]|nr:hypothetical protein [Pyrinomonadaceae bacterium]